MTISKKRLAEIAAIADDKIDTSDIPAATEEVFSRARLALPGGKRAPQGRGGQADH